MDISKLCGVGNFMTVVGCLLMAMWMSMCNTETGKVTRGLGIREAGAVPFCEAFLNSGFHSTVALNVCPTCNAGPYSPLPVELQGFSAKRRLSS